MGQVARTQKQGIRRCHHDKNTNLEHLFCARHCEGGLPKKSFHLTLKKIVWVQLRKQAKGSDASQSQGKGSYVCTRALCCRDRGSPHFRKCALLPQLSHGLISQLLCACGCHDTARTWVSLSTHGDMLEGPEGCPKSLFPNNDPKLSKLTRASAVSGDNINWVKTCPPAHL